MKPTVFLLCAGLSQRIGSTKQLLPVGGEPIIRRTIRLIKEFDPEIRIYMLTWKKELMFDDVFTIDTVTRPPQLSDTILLSKKYWGERNIFLLGDTVYGEDTMNTILSDENGITVFYRDISPAKHNSERFSLAFSKEDSDVVTDLLKKSSRIYAGTILESCCGLWKLCYTTHPEGLLWLISPILYTNGNNRHIRLIRPFRDYLIYHIYPRFWKPYRIITLKPVSDRITTDIDTPEEYTRFLALGVV